MKEKIVKVCGINDLVNHEAIATLGIDMIGLNFYSESKRYLTIPILPYPEIQYVGVFVQSSVEEIKRVAKKIKLALAQLHGDESVEFCKAIQEFIPVIKAFRVDEEFDFSSTSAFNFCDYFLFDTKTPSFGGSGRKFDWSNLNKYDGHVPFLLSGGIDSEDYKSINAIEHPMFAGIDINSKFETSPGIKDVELVYQFLQNLKHDTVEISS